jgi:hypothetical protein
MKKYLIVKADYNDGDYVTQKSEIFDAEIPKIKEIISLISSNHRIQWRTGEEQRKHLTEQHPELSEEQIQLLDTLTPYGEYGVHTIVRIELLEVANEEVLL